MPRDKGALGRTPSATQRRSHAPSGRTRRAQQAAEADQNFKANYWQACSNTFYKIITQNK